MNNNNGPPQLETNQLELTHTHADEVHTNHLRHHHYYYHYYHDNTHTPTHLQLGTLHTRHTHAHTTFGAPNKAMPTYRELAKPPTSSGPLLPGRGLLSPQYLHLGCSRDGTWMNGALSRHTRHRAT